VPLRVISERIDPTTDDQSDPTLTNISLGGLSFFFDQALNVSDLVEISFPSLKQENQVTGRVAWCEKAIKGYEIGIEFDRSEEVFRLRMIEQICHIEHYRREVMRSQGRELTARQAAEEWIQRYADDFPEA